MYPGKSLLDPFRLDRFHLFYSPADDQTGVVMKGRDVKDTSIPVNETTNGWFGRLYTGQALDFPLSMRRFVMFFWIVGLLEFCHVLLHFVMFFWIVGLLEFLNHISTNCNM